MKKNISVSFCREILIFLSTVYLIACSSQPSQSPTVSELSQKQAILVLLSSSDKSHLLSPEPELYFLKPKNLQQDSVLPIIKIQEEKKYQQIVGFGAALLDGTAKLLNESITKESIDDLWLKLFDSQKGIGLSFLRLGIGASDLSEGLYSYEDTPGKFSVEHDQQVFALVRKAIEINPRLKIMGSPWSPPGWMKTNGSMIKGSLDPLHQEDFAKYLSKTVRSWKNEGLPVYAITIQNEPKNNNNFTTSVFNLHPKDFISPLAPVDEQTFVTNYLGPLFQVENPDTKILIWDHNYEQSGTNMIEQVHETLRNAPLRKYTGGAAFHCYSRGNIPSLISIPNSFPGQDIYMTECSSGTWRSWGDQFTYDAAHWIIEPLRAGAKVILKWGLVLDDHHRPYLSEYDGSCSKCIGSVVIHNKPDETGYTGKWSFERDYYILGQISKFVQPGAYRIESTEPEAGHLKNVAFENSDHSKVLYVFNSKKVNQMFRVECKKGYFDYEMPPLSVVTFKWDLP